ncbi:MAG TPA: hypothetical protein EYQ82_10815 [Dehalococcoidia bacterium]|nr:hypothetical protein [Dehalococcoidia bacterium]
MQWFSQLINLAIMQAQIVNGGTLEDAFQDAREREEDDSGLLEREWEKTTPGSLSNEDLLTGGLREALRKRGEHPDPVRPTTELVTEGPYAHSRNPIYVSFSLVALGIALLLNSYWVLGSVPIAALALNFLVVTREERYLETVIGHQYSGYRESVRRWL